MRAATVDYSNRQVDLEIMQTIYGTAGGVTPLSLSLTDSPPKVITGMQKLAQRYTATLLTQAGDVHFDATFGTSFWYDMLRGAAQNPGQVSLAFAFASLDAVSQMQADDTREEKYGSIPNDERIVSARLLTFDVNYATATLYLQVELYNQDGDAYTYVIPVTVVRS